MIGADSIVPVVGGLALDAVLAAEEDIGKAGPVGLLLILSLLIAVFFLGRSMLTHLRRVPLEFPPPTPPVTQDPEGPATTAGPDTPRPRTG